MNGNFRNDLSTAESTLKGVFCWRRGWESNPSTGLRICKLLILQNGRNAENDTSAEWRYTKGTRAPLGVARTKGFTHAPHGAPRRRARRGLEPVEAALVLATHCSVRSPDRRGKHTAVTAAAQPDFAPSRLPSLPRTHRPWPLLCHLDGWHLRGP